MVKKTYTKKSSKKKTSSPKRSKSSKPSKSQLKAFMLKVGQKEGQDVVGKTSKAQGRRAGL